MSCRSLDHLVDLPQEIFASLFSSALTFTVFQIDVPREHLDHPYGVVYHQGVLYWTEAIKGEVRSWNLTLGNMSQNATIIRTDSKPLFDMVLVMSQLVQANGEWGSLCACMLS